MGYLDRLLLKPDIQTDGVSDALKVLSMSVVID